MSISEMIPVMMRMRLCAGFFLESTKLKALPTASTFSACMSRYRDAAFYLSQRYL